MPEEQHMRLYSLNHASAIDDPQHGHFEPDPEHGGFDLPDELADRLHSFHQRKRRAWETEEERGARLHGEESARRRDPETLYNAVAEIAAAARGQVQPVPADVMAEIAALRAELAELRAEKTEAGSGEPAPDKPAPRSKASAAKAADK